MTKTTLCLLISTALITSAAVAAKPVGKRAAKPAPITLNSKAPRQSGGWEYRTKILKFDVQGQLGQAGQQAISQPPEEPGYQCVSRKDAARDTILSRINAIRPLPKGCFWRNFSARNGAIRAEANCAMEGGNVLKNIVEGAVTTTKEDLTFSTEGVDDVVGKAATVMRFTNNRADVCDEHYGESFNAVAVDAEPSPHDGMIQLSCTLPDDPDVRNYMEDASTEPFGWTLKQPDGSSAPVFEAKQPSWVPVPGAVWIGPDTTEAAAGAWVFSRKLWISPCSSPVPVKLSIVFRADNRGAFRLKDANGTVITSAAQIGVPDSGFMAKSLTDHSYTFPSGASGDYVLELEVQNTGGATGATMKAVLSR